MYEGSRLDSWMSPIDIIERVHLVMGGIDLDIASSPRANMYVRAKRYLTKRDNALSSPWTSNGKPISVFCNPPGGKVGTESIASLFFDEILIYRQYGLIREAIFLAFNLSFAQVSQNYPRLSMCDFPLCIPKYRLVFRHPETLKNGESIQFPSCICYIPGIIDNTAGFARMFSDVGKIVVPYKEIGE